MGLPRVFVTRKISQDALSRLTQYTDLAVWEGLFPPPRAQLELEVKRCDGLLTMITDVIDAHLLENPSNLKVISNMATGLDNIDIETATSKGILIGSTPGVLAKTCAELTFAILLAAARRIVEGDHFVHDGSWQTWHPGQMLGLDLYNRTLGVVGLGSIGSEVASRAVGFEMDVVYYQRERRRDLETRFGLRFAETLDELLKQSDYVSLHVPLTRETYHMIGKNQLNTMRSNAILVNTTRGAVVDQQALVKALQNQTIRGAALDVMEEEPINPGDPILNLENVVLTPHIGSASEGTRRKMEIIAVENLLNGLQGKPMPNCVNPDAVDNRE